jgi:hypothetical protein
MPRKKSGVPKQRPPRQLSLAAHLPADDQAMLAHVAAGWAAIKADSALFATPTPGSPQMDNAIASATAAVQAAQGGSDAQKETARTDCQAVRNLWGQLVKYVEGVLRAGPATAAPPILDAVRMYMSARGARKPKPPLAMRQLGSGQVLLVALALANALTYDWEWSGDQQNWSTTTTGRATATVAGLTPGKLYYFRMRAFLRGNTATAYVQTVSMMVI